MSELVNLVVKSCIPCQTKSKPTPQHKHLASKLAGFPFQTISMDFVGPLPRSKTGKRYILTAKCTFSKWVEAWATNDMLATTVVEKLTQLFTTFGLPEQIHSDQGTQFTSTLLHDVGRALEIKVTHTPAYNPCLLYTSPSPRDQRGSRMPSSA